MEPKIKEAIDLINKRLDEIEWKQRRIESLVNQIKKRLPSHRDVYLPEPREWGDDGEMS